MIRTLSIVILSLASFSLFSMEDRQEWEKRKSEKRARDEKTYEIDVTTQALQLLKIDDTENSSKKIKRNGNLLPINDLTSSINEARLSKYNDVYKEQHISDHFWINYDLCNEIQRGLKLYNDSQSFPWDNRTTIEDLVSNTNWNTLTLYKKNIANPFYLFQHQLWIQRNEDEHGNDTTQFRFLDEKTQEQLIIEPRHGSGPVFFDGPNNDNIILVGMNEELIKNNKSHSCDNLDKSQAYFYSLLQLAGKKRFEHIKQFDYENSEHKNEEITALALAPSKHYALAISKIIQKTKDKSEHSLAIFSYAKDEKCESQLMAKSALPEKLKKIAFITQKTLMGLTHTGRLYTLWIDGKDIKNAPQKTPMDVQIPLSSGTQNQPKINGFAIDPLHPNQMIMQYTAEDGYNERIAFINLNFRDPQGRIVYKVLPTSPNSDPDFRTGLYYYDDSFGDKIQFKGASFRKFRLTPFQLTHIKEFLKKSSTLEKFE